MVASNVKVMVRTRPSAHFSSSGITVSPDQKGLKVHIPKRGNSPQAEYSFVFEQILHEASQEDVFEGRCVHKNTGRVQAAAVEAIQSVFQGYNATILAYGQTGAGKTYTMSGGKGAYATRGLIPRVISQLFADAAAFSSKCIDVSVTYAEVYNESLFDLLDSSTNPSDISITEHGGSVAVKGLSSRRAEGEAQALDAFFEGEGMRVMGEHELNRESSRSHSVFTITVEMRNDPRDPQVVRAKLNLVDLAGSERVYKTKSEGTVLREAGHINKSLSILEQVVLALADSERGHIPYRSSKLTHMLKDSLGGNCRTIMIANVWGEAAQIDETLSTCRFAQRMAQIQNEVTVNVIQDDAQLAAQYAREIAELRAEVALLRGAAAEGCGDTAGARGFSEELYARAVQQVAEFMAALPSDRERATLDIAPIEISSTRHVRHVLHAARYLYNEARAPSRAALSRPTPLPGALPQAQQPQQQQQRQEAQQQQRHRQDMAESAGGGSRGVEVGDEVSAGGSFGVAPADARPGAQPADRAADPAPGARHKERGGEVSSGVGVAPRIDVATETPPDAPEALQLFRETEGAAKAAAMAENAAKCTAGKRRAKQLALAINDTKHTIDELKREHDECFALEDTEAAAKVADAARAAKSRYRDLHSELTAARADVAHAQGLVERCQRELLADFADWHVRRYGCAVGESVSVSVPGTPAASVAGSWVPPASVAGSAAGSLAGPGAVPGGGARPPDYGAESKAFYDAQRRHGGGSREAARRKVAPKQLGMGTGRSDRDAGMQTNYAIGSLRDM